MAYLSTISELAIIIVIYTWYIPVVGLEASGSGSLADTLGESLSVGVPGSR